MKKLILFISLTLAFSASFAGIRPPSLGFLFFEVKMPVFCINNNELLPVFFELSTLDTKVFASKYSNFSSIRYVYYPCDYFNESSMPKPKASIAHLEAICLSEYSLMPKQKYEEVFKGKTFLFRDILSFTESKKAIEKITIKAQNAECGNTGKKIKPTTITKIKRFHPIILETLE